MDRSNSRRVPWRDPQWSSGPAQVRLITGLVNETALGAINCSALPEELLDAELFGCKKGAFTGSLSDRVGLVEAADKATLFLDEVGDMPVRMQAKLLRVLQEREVVRLGENRPRPVD